MSEEADKRQRILTAAIAHFARTGLAQARIADIATDAEVGKGTVYEYFRSKEDLLLAACLAHCSAHEAEIDRRSGLAGPGEFQAALESGAHPVALVHRVLSAVITVCLTGRHAEQRLFSELSSLALTHPDLAARARSELAPRLDGWRAQAEALYQLAVDAGHFRRLPASADASRLIVAAVDGLIWQQQWETPTDPAALAGRMASAWCRLHLKEPERLEEYLS